MDNRNDILPPAALLTAVALVWLAAPTGRAGLSPAMSGRDRQGQLTPSALRTPARPAARSRTIRTATWQVMWRVRAGTGQAIRDPIRLVADSAHVYVLDAGWRRILALDARSGREVWSTGTVAGGKPPVTAPTDLTLTPQGELAVADPSARRIVVFRPDGRVARVVDQPSPTIHSMCALRDSSFLIVTLNPTAPVLQITRNGEMRGALEAPWKGFTKPGEVQGVLAPMGDGERCVYGLQTGSGFSTVSAGGFDPARDYVEAYDGKGTFTGLALVSGPGVVGVLFRGLSDLRYRVVDLYAGNGYGYRASLKLPTEMKWVAKGGPTLYGIERRGTAHFIVALQPKQGLAALLR